MGTKWDGVLNNCAIADMDAIGKEAQLRGFEFARSITLVAEPFTMENGLLTSTFKFPTPAFDSFPKIPPLLHNNYRPVRMTKLPTDLLSFWSYAQIVWLCTHSTESKGHFIWDHKHINNVVEIYIQTTLTLKTVKKVSQDEDCIPQDSPVFQDPLHPISLNTVFRFKITKEIVRRKRTLLSVLKRYKASSFTAWRGVAADESTSLTTSCRDQENL
ncbi:hypothetical protein LXL04_033764 [Taraxacum kok-saghyz]